MSENEMVTLIEEGEDILDGLETMLEDEGSGVSTEVLIDTTDIITAIILAGEIQPKKLAPIFLKDGKQVLRKTGRAGSMIKMREELRKLKNQRLKSKTRTLADDDFEEMEIGEIRRADYTRRMDRGVLRSDKVPSKLLQDKSKRIQVIGADVEALYPSLSAMEVGDIVYNAMLETKVKFDRS